MLQALGNLNCLHRESIIQGGVSDANIVKAKDGSVVFLNWETACLLIDSGFVSVPAKYSWAKDERCVTMRHDLEALLIIAARHYMLAHNIRGVDLMSEIKGYKSMTIARLE